MQDRKTMKKTARVYIIFGGDEFAVKSKARELIQALVPLEEQVLGLEEIDGRAEAAGQAVNALRRCIEAVRTVGFLGAGKVVWLQDVDFLGNSKICAAAAVKVCISDLVEMIEQGLPEGQKLLITSAKIDKRSVLYKICMKNGAEIHEFAIPEKHSKMNAQARERAEKELSRFNLKMPDQLLDAFLDKVGTETRQIAGEVNKLALYMGGRHEVRPEDVSAVVCMSREVLAWDLEDAVGEKKLAKALKVLRQLLFQKQSPIWLVMSLERRMNQLMILREALDNGWARLQDSGKWQKVVWNLPPEVDEMFSNLGREDPRKSHPYRVMMLTLQAGRFSASELRACREMIMRAHERLVSTGMAKPMILEILLLRMLGAGANQNN